jgi:hypothetical protein
MVESVSKELENIFILFIYWSNSCFVYSDDNFISLFFLLLKYKKRSKTPTVGPVCQCLLFCRFIFTKSGINPLAPSDPYMGRTAQLTSRRCILNTYSTNIRTEYFKHAA